MSFSLNEELIRQVIQETSPAAQQTDAITASLGFGFIHYSVIRALRVRSSLIIGSRRGFVPICQAIAMKDAALGGRIVFVDPGFSDAEDGFQRGMGGYGFWKNKDDVSTLFQTFGVANIITHKPITSQTFFTSSTDQFHLIYIDADHSYDGFRHDFNHAISALDGDGLIMFHDSLVTKQSLPSIGDSFGVFDYLENEGKKLFDDIEIMTLPIMPGLGFARRSHPRTRGVLQRNYNLNFTIHDGPSPRRNSDCPCGSGIRYKHCHGKDA